MSQKLLHRLVGFAVFLFALVVYVMTVQPSVSFWDCGEFIASSYLMQVPHPPGTPFFLILGKLFSMLPIGENIAFRVNMVSVLSSAFNVLFLYLVAVKLIENYKKEHENNFDALLTYLASAVGAFSLAFADTFWFNAVEAEVYALSVFFIGFVTWLIMLWNADEDHHSNDKYILLIAYLLGISAGVHLMAVLATVPIVMIIYFKNYVEDDEVLQNTAIIFAGHVAVSLVVAFLLWFTETGSTPPSRDAYSAFDSRFLMIEVAVSMVYMGVFWKKILKASSFYIPIILGGMALVATYPGMVKYVPTIMNKIGGNDETINMLVLFGIFAGLLYLIYWTHNTNKRTFNLIAKSLLFVMVGLTSYLMIIIRANQDPPINLNSPKTPNEVVSYLNREQYGDFPTFKRRYTQEPHQQIVYSNYSSDGDFWWSYQMDHMFNRYLEWNYIGRGSTVQDSGVDWSDMWGLPFLIGLFGFLYHFKRDWKMASIFFVMFIFLGYLTAFYQNQQQPQPRERDYFYVGAFFVYSIWVALGVRGILDMVIGFARDTSGKMKPVLPAITILLAFLAVPVNMLYANYWEHDRSRNYIPWDYSYNLLQSVEPNAILFTNGDNDTFPLWYLQDVEGVRRDVRIANLSLLNTGWYIKQLKNTTPHGTDKIKMSYSDLEIDRIGPARFEARNMSIPVPENVYRENGVTDTSLINKGKLTWRMNPPTRFGDINAARVQDLVALDIIRSNAWERPIYFAVTCSDDSKLSMQDYLLMEGLAMRVTPVKRPEYYERVNEDLMAKQIFDDSDEYSKSFRPGFKFRGLNDSTLFLDQNHKRLTGNYRNAFIRLAMYYYHVARDNKKVIAALDEMEEKLPRKIIPLDYRLLHDVGNIYFQAGAIDRYLPIAEEIEEIAWQKMKENPRDVNHRYSPYLILRDIYENLNQYDKLVDVFERLNNVVPNNPQIQSMLNQYKAMARNADSSEVKLNK